MLPWLRPLTGVVFIFALAVRTTERRLVEALEAAGAMTPETAVALPLTHFLRRWVFGRLLSVGAVGVTSTELSYINVPVYAEHRMRRRRRVLWVIPVVIGLGLLAYFLSTRP